MFVFYRSTSYPAYERSVRKFNGSCFNLHVFSAARSSSSSQTVTFVGICRLWISGIVRVGQYG